jgi:hypothetical protein
MRNAEYFQIRVFEVQVLFYSAIRIPKSAFETGRAV